MTEAAGKIRLFVESASAAHRTGNYVLAAACYQKASQLAVSRLNHPVLAGTLRHLQYLEQLLAAGLRDSRLVRRLIANLQDLSADPVDDRLPDQLAPLIHYFTALALCVAKRPTPEHEAEAFVLIEQTRGRHYMDACANVLTRLYLLSLPSSQRSLDHGEELGALVSDIEADLDSLPMPGEFARVLENVHHCLCSLGPLDRGAQKLFGEYLRGLELLDPASPAALLVASIMRDYLLTLMKVRLQMSESADVVPVLTASHCAWVQSDGVE